MKFWILRISLSFIKPLFLTIESPFFLTKKGKYFRDKDSSEKKDEAFELMELFEFYRLLPKDQISALSEQISSIQISIDFEHCDASIKKLFIYFYLIKN